MRLPCQQASTADSALEQAAFLSPSANAIFSGRALQRTRRHIDAALAAIDKREKRMAALERTRAWRLRGPSGAKDEFLLAATAQNLRRLARLGPAMPGHGGGGGIGHR